jgi:hypothetical protein
VTNEVLHRAKEARNILNVINRREANWIWHILRKNCLLKHVTGRYVKGNRRRGRRRKLLLDDLKGRKRWWDLKEEELVHTLWRTRFGRVYGSVARQNAQ